MGSKRGNRSGLKRSSSLEALLDVLGILVVSASNLLVEFAVSLVDKRHVLRVVLHPRTGEVGVLLSILLLVSNEEHDSLRGIFDLLTVGDAL